MLFRTSILVLAAAQLCAINIAAQAIPATRVRSGTLNRDTTDSVRVAMQRPVPTPATRWSHTKRGAVIGTTTLGVLGALVAYTQVQTGCDAVGGGSPCHAGRTRAGLALWGGTLGGAFGGATGGIVGFAWPVHRVAKQ